ncbi:11122_t:CDS:2, partial [Racocetra persica]
KYIDDISLNKENDATLSDYADIYIKCCSSELFQRPELDEISKKLENLSEKTTIELIINITNCININSQQTTQSISNYLERLDSSNDIIKSIDMDKHHEDNPNEPNYNNL